MNGEGFRPTGSVERHRTENPLEAFEFAVSLHFQGNPGCCSRHRPCPANGAMGGGHGRLRPGRGLPRLCMLGGLLRIDHEKGHGLLEPLPLA